MFNKFQVAGFSALNLIVATATAQSILDHAQESSKPVAAVAAVLRAVTTPAPAPVVAPAPEPKVTIQDLANKQAKAMAAESSKKVNGGQPGASGTPPAGPLVVGELAPATPIPVTMTPNFKPLKAPVPPPPRPYFAALIGFKGQEIAEINIGNGVSAPFKVGDSIKEWKITRVIDGRLILVSTSTRTSKKKKKAAPAITERVLSVGEYL